jgi:hypothetical protein
VDVVDVLVKGLLVALTIGGAIALLVSAAGGRDMGGSMRGTGPRREGRR